MLTVTPPLIKAVSEASLWHWSTEDLNLRLATIAIHTSDPEVEAIHTKERRVILRILSSRGLR